jgi:hypothetical protein
MTVFAGIFFLAGQCLAVSFTPKELFRIPFGSSSDKLGSRVEGDQFFIPRDFAMDDGGRFYIYDRSNHRVARFSADGKYEIGYRYLPTAKQVFAHPDARQNLWLLISDPARGLFYGVYDQKGKSLRSGIFAQFNTFRLHVDDGGRLHAIVSSDKKPAAPTMYILDGQTLLMKKENAPPPPENHHEVRNSNHTFFIDSLPGAAKGSEPSVSRITDEAHRGVAEIEGIVIYVTNAGDVYTRVNKRQINVYDVSGSLKGKVQLKGLSASCAALRFDEQGNLYQLDGIPDQTDEEAKKRAEGAGPQADLEDLHYTQSMPGMRMIKWERN